VPRILISYRRGDADPTVYRIHETLSHRYGSKSVFIDVDDMPFGADFRDHIKKVLKEIDILLAIIGPNWLNEIQKRAAENKTDYVQQEIEAALQRKIPVIPVLVQKAEMPDPSVLPRTLQNLAFHHAAEVDQGRDFRIHMDRLAREIDRILGIEVKVAPSIEVKVAADQKPDLETKGGERGKRGSFFQLRESRELRIILVLTALSLGSLAIIASCEYCKYSLPTSPGLALLGSWLVFFAISVISANNPRFTIFAGAIVHTFAFFAVVLLSTGTLLQISHGSTWVEIPPMTTYLLLLFGPFALSMLFLFVENRLNRNSLPDRVQRTGSDDSASAHVNGNAT
jgi:hypothetical protein